MLEARRVVTFKCSGQLRDKINKTPWGAKLCFRKMLLLSCRVRLARPGRCEYVREFGFQAMKIEKVSIKNFRCFGPRGTKIKLESGVTAFVGGNGSGKTAVFQALSRLFGITPAQRAVRRQDFHLPADQQELQSGATLSIEVLFSFPELGGLDEDAAEDAVPEFFLQMAASAPGAPLKARMRLQATWTDDGTPDGSIDEDLRWITTLDDDFEWDDCKRVQAVERGSIQLIYVPAARDAAGQVTALLKGRLWQAAKWSDGFRERSAASAQNIQRQFEREAACAIYH